MTNDFLFVYGLLRASIPHEMSDWLRTSASYISEAFFQGRLYLIESYPGAVPSDEADERVFGDLYQVSHTVAFDTLDTFEGIGADFAAPTEYVRQEVPIKLPDGTTLLAWIYLYNWSLEGKKRILSGDFLKR